MKYRYRFNKGTPMRRREFYIFSLRKDGFSAVEEHDWEEHNDYLITNALIGQISLSVGTWRDINF